LSQPTRTIIERPSPVPHRSIRWDRIIGESPRALVGALVALLFVFPFVWMLVTSLKSSEEVLSFPPNFVPWPVSFEGYIGAWEAVPMVRFAINNLIQAGGILALQLPLCAFAAYAFSQFEFRFKRPLFVLCLMAMMIPSQVTFLPNFLLMRNLGWLDTFAALIVPYASSGFGIFLMRQAFLQISKDLVNAAKLDGANHLQIIWHVMAPIARPTIVTFALFSFVYHWNDYFWPLVMTNSDSVRTLPIGVAMLRDGEARQNWNILMAGNMAIVLPVLIVFLLAQRQLVRAFAHGGDKG
jgi:sn-glycerol 3-phosphate transport system permease protein